MSFFDKFARPTMSLRAKRSNPFCFNTSTWLPFHQIASSFHSSQWLWYALLPAGSRRGGLIRTKRKRAISGWKL